MVKKLVLEHSFARKSEVKKLLDKNLSESVAAQIAKGANPGRAEELERTIKLLRGVRTGYEKELRDLDVATGVAPQIVYDNESQDI